MAVPPKEKKKGKKKQTTIPIHPFPLHVDSVTTTCRRVRFFFVFFALLSFCIMSSHPIEFHNNHLVPIWSRGADVLRRRRIERFYFLVKQPVVVPVAQDPLRAVFVPDSDDDTYASHRYLLQEMDAGSLYPLWAPRNVPMPYCSTYSEFKTRQLDTYEVPLSLLGHRDSNSMPLNPFARKTPTFLHMPFAQITDFLTELHPDDRFLAYVLTGNTPVHMYFDLDGKFDKFPWLCGKEEECIELFLLQLSEFFYSLFQRPLDMSGLLLLQASSDSKMSWHIHLRSEAFLDMKQHKLFIKALQHWLEESQQIADNEEERMAATTELEAADDDDDEDEDDDGGGAIHTSAACRSTLKLCDFQTSVTASDTASQAHQVHPIRGHYNHLVDAAPYSATQNIRAPYNRKPGKTPLLVRAHRCNAAGVVKVARKAALDESSIDPDVLFQAHPMLALPSGTQYSFLKMESLSSSTVTTSHASLNRTVSTKNNDNNGTTQEMLSVTDSETVRRMLSGELGSTVRFRRLVWTQSTTHGTVICATARKGTAHCPYRSPSLSAPYKHHSNPVQVMLTSRGVEYRCFHHGCRVVRSPWPTSDDVSINVLKQRLASATATASVSPLAVGQTHHTGNGTLSSKCISSCTS